MNKIKSVVMAIYLGLPIFVEAEDVRADPTNVFENQHSISSLEPIENILIRVDECSASIVFRSQALSEKLVSRACQQLIQQEKNFHQIFGTQDKPVKDDHNVRLRANFYSSNENYVKYATAHFNMPTNNGGMYLEGYPEKKNNHAEFVAYQKNGGLWNLRHEFIHYLDGRFNHYGDYCNGLHDDHAGPEFCAEPHLAYPHLVWWTEGIAEFLAKGDDNPKAVTLAASKQYPISELFNTSSNQNGGTERVYYWGYLAVRFMMENQPRKIEEMLLLTRRGDWNGYQQLVGNWSTQFDQQWYAWLEKLTAK